ncbi:MAG: c-type cytochrome [Proteobacteria bacterium]|nr:c-type cytochrome [Pseudomonadota bacterium]
MSQVDDAEFVRNFSLILVFLAVVGITAFILAKMVNLGFQETQNNDVVIAERIAPVGRVNVGEPFVAASASGGEMSAAHTETAAVDTGPVDPGKAAYGKICFACHDMAVGGAPKFGDAAAWAGRMDKGFEMVTSNAINGFTGQLGMMPPKGGLPSLSDDEVKAAVKYMLAALGGDNSQSAVDPTTSPEPSASTDTTLATTSTDAVAPVAVADGRGKEIYAGACFVCHDTGSAGAPKIGDAAAWSARIVQGTDALYTHAVKGFMGETGLMPPKGGRMDYSDDDVKAAVDYMLSESQ